VSSAALAQGTPGNTALSYEALQKAPVGAWAEYQMTVSGQNGTTLRYALVEKTPKTLGIEIETVMPPLVMRMDFAAGLDAWNLSRIRMRMGGAQVQDVPVPEGGQQLIRKGGSFGKLIGAETLKVAGGTYDCKHYQQKTEQGDSEVWMSEKAPPAGLVQTVMSSLGAKITLKSLGSGAKAQIK
jgi:hypothetical protein